MGSCTLEPAPPSAVQHSTSSSRAASPGPPSLQTKPRHCSPNKAMHGVIKQRQYGRYGQATGDGRWKLGPPLVEGAPKAQARLKQIDSPANPWASDRNTWLDGCEQYWPQPLKQPVSCACLEGRGGAPAATDLVVGCPIKTMLCSPQ